ncbi:hypothetical protein OZN62_13635 [Aurantiacibacter sp. MUD11]|uniref:hypothetical protein n=1 Tax=Aurantiacibacter sp. MUD11 TaxID=3003265 RepID=UPI0022AB0DCD|nr:hypothetical protein [Aurantiacibacter sp. MUD11]WAT17938.1 hypothetical protein OZN62_13635 [Aurantiacibacter sp. MUD11]
MRENKLKHLEFVQGVINRLSTNSFLLKGWSVGLASALFALASFESKPEFLYLALIPALIFWGLDGYCLWQERLFRALFNEIRIKDENDTDFDMNTERVKGKASWIGSVFSITLIPFHGAIAGAIIIVKYIGVQ